MIIKLKNILTIYICPDHNEKYHMRKDHMDKLLTKLGFTNFIHYKSSTENYPLCLNNATIDIFSRYQPPFLLLEDDIQPNIDIPDELDIPNETDAFYLGLSKHAGHKYNNYNEGLSKFSQKNYNILKIENMLSAHAILYVDSNYIQQLRNQLITKPTYFNDVIMSQNQYKYNIYCNNYCYFYQAIEFDGQEEPTRITVSSNEITRSSNEITRSSNENYTLTFVTAFLNINNCDVNQYFPYFERLAKSKIPIVLFMDINYKEYGEYLIKTYSNVKILKYITKKDLYVTKYTKNKKLPITRNYKKDTEDYLTLMNNKIYFVEEAMNSNLFNTSIFSWIDFRIYHIFSNDKLINNKLYELSIKKYDNDIKYFPGNLTNINNIIDSINWRFLGGLFIIDKVNINNLVNKISILLNNLDTLTWEVNVWAILEYNNLFSFNWYYSDHNNSLILNI